MDHGKDSHREHAEILLGIGAKPKGASGGHMSPEESDKHGTAAMKEFADALASGDHAGMHHALRAHQAATDGDGDEYDHGDGDAGSEGPGAQ